MKNLFVVGAVVFFSFGAQAQSVKEKKVRASVEAAFTESTAKVTDCGKKFKFVYDFKSFDSIDFKKLGREKVDQLGSEVPNLAEFGEGVNALCADKDYKDALQKVTTIVYKPTNNDQIAVKASLAGGTLTIENYVMGSTRGKSDYESAVKEAL